MFDAFHDVEAKAKAGNAQPKRVMQSWADAEWFTTRPKVPEKITFTVFKVTGETNTDDLSPAPDAWSRPDIPLHALAMLKNPARGHPTRPRRSRSSSKKGFPSLTSATSSARGSTQVRDEQRVVVHGRGHSQRAQQAHGGLCIGSKIAPIFFNTMEDSGALPIEMPVDDMAMGDVVDIYPYEGVAKRHETGEEICRFSLKTDVILDEVQAGGRINLIIGRGLTARAGVLACPSPTSSVCPRTPRAALRGLPSRRKWWARLAAWRKASSRGHTASRR